MSRYVILIVLAALARPAAGELVLHYTFDNADRVGSTIRDVAGSADATAIGAVGFGALGQIEQSIFFPNDDGGSYVELPAASNPMPNGDDARTIAFWFNQFQVGTENKMFGHGTGGAGRSFDVSLEGGGVRLRYSGGNVTWGQGFEFTEEDAGWQHLAIRVPVSATNYLDVDVLLNGSPLASMPTGGNPGSTAINTGGGAPTTLNLGRSPVFAPAGDFVGRLDDFRVYDEALSDAAIVELAGGFDGLVLEIDQVTGAVAVRNSTDASITLDYYELTSPTGALRVTEWDPLGVQDREGFPAGSGVGDGWEVFGGATPHLLAEGRLVGDSELAAGAAIILGDVYDPTMPLDLELTFRSDGSFRTGRIGRVGSVGPGDYNADGVVDAADYTLWRDNLGMPAGTLVNDIDGGIIDSDQYQTWRANFGTTTSARASLAALPEPNAALLLAVGLLAVPIRRPHR